MMITLYVQSVQSLDQYRDRVTGFGLALRKSLGWQIKWFLLCSSGNLVGWAVIWNLDFQVIFSL